MSISEMFHEIDRERFKLAVLGSIVNVVLVFLALHYIVEFFSISEFINVAISVIVFYLSMHTYMKKFDLSSLKKRDPKIEEMLKTARDNVKEDNIIVTEFFKQVTEKVKDISFSDLLSLKNLSIRLACIVIVAMFSVLMPAAVLAQQVGFAGFVFPDINIGQGIGIMDKNDVLNNPDLIDASQDIMINIQPSTNELDFSKIKEIEDREFARNPFPTAAEAVSDTPSSEKAPEDFDLIKEYSLAIRQD